MKFSIVLLVFTLLTITTPFLLKRKHKVQQEQPLINLKPLIQKTQSTQVIKQPTFFNLQLKDNCLYIPTKYNNISLQTAITSTEVPSWLFIQKNAQLCSQNQDKIKCSKVSSKISCDTSKSCNKSKYQSGDISNQILDITGENQLSINYQINNQSFSGKFIQPSKVILKRQNLINKKIYAMINLADWEYAILQSQGKNYQLKILNNKDQATFKNQQSIILNNFNKDSTIDNTKIQELNDKNNENSQEINKDNNLNDNNQQQQQQQETQKDKKQQQSKKDQNKSNKKKQQNQFYVIANEQDNTRMNFDVEKIKINLQKPQDPIIFSVPTSVGRYLRKIIIKKYLKGDCDIYNNSVQCKRKGSIQNIPIDLCFSQNSCIRINADSLIKSNSKNKFDFLFRDNDNENLNKNISLNIEFLKLYSMLIQKGQLKQLLKNEKYKLVTLSSDDDQDQDLNSQNDSQEYAVNVEGKQNKAKSFYIGTIIVSIGIYALIAIVLLLLIKMKATQSFVAKILDFTFGAIAGYFHRKRGYQPPTMGQQIDDCNTMNVGYQKDDSRGRQLFWEKNSVQGI